MPRAFRAIIAFALLCLATASGAAQDAPTVTWEMAFLKGEIVKPASQELSKPIALKSGDKFQVYLRVIKPKAYVYVLFCGLDGTMTSLFRGSLDEGTALILPSPDETFSVTPPSGTEYLYALVSATRQAALEKLLGKAARDSGAILDEIKRIQASFTALTEIPQKPVPMGGVSRGGLEFMKATQYEGRGSYVKIIRLDH